jgi:hypothetical protein
VDALIQKFQNIRTLIRQENLTINKVLADKKLKEFVIFLNTEKQMRRQHIDSKGREITDQFTGATTYAELTAKLNPRKVAGTKYTLNDDGIFFNSFEVTQLPEGGYLIKANPNRGDSNLFEKYGENIVGLTDESKEQFNKMFLTEFIKFMRNEIERI